MTRDLTKGSPAKVILAFTIPLLLGNIFQQVYSMADTIIVGRTISMQALAAVGATGSISFFVIGFVTGLTAGFSVLTAQRFGAGDEEGVRSSVTCSIVLSAAITVVMTVVSVALTRPVLQLMQTPEDIIEDAYRYIVVIFGGIGTTVLFNLLSNIIRALGDSRTPLLFLVIACLLNIVLDFVFILYFHMGVAGAAWATILAQLVSGALCLVYIARRFPILRLHKRDWRIDIPFLMRHMGIGLPMAFQSSIIAVGAMILQAALNQLGSDAVAAYTAAQKIEQVGVQPLMSFGMTMATYTAQNYGAGKMDRVRRGVRQCTLMTVSISVALGIIIILGGRFFVGLFIREAPDIVMAQAQIYLWVNCSLYFVLSLLFVWRYTLQGLGKSFVPTLAGIIELVMRAFGALVLVQLLGFTGVSMSGPIAWLGAAITLGIAYFRHMHLLFVKNPAPSLENIPADQ